MTFKVTGLNGVFIIIAYYAFSKEKILCFIANEFKKKTIYIV